MTGARTSDPIRKLVSESRAPDPFITFFAHCEKTGFYMWGIGSALTRRRAQIIHRPKFPMTTYGELSSCMLRAAGVILSFISFIQSWCFAQGVEAASQRAGRAGPVGSACWSLILREIGSGLCGLSTSVVHAVQTPGAESENGPEAIAAGRRSPYSEIGGTPGAASVTANASSVRSFGSSPCGS